MQELEKILEEIEIRAIKDLEEENDRCSTTCEGCCSDVKERKCNCRDAIIVRAFKKLAKCMNDGWITVDERLPKRTLDEKMNKSYKKYLVFIDSVDGWDIDIAVYDFWNDKKWCEAHDGYGEIENVIAWRPLPDPYRPKVTKP